jgi:hypothetical protein
MQENAFIFSSNIIGDNGFNEFFYILQNTSLCKYYSGMNSILFPCWIYIKLEKSHFRNKTMFNTERFILVHNLEVMMLQTVKFRLLYLVYEGNI